jgi:hypothetical protein
MAKKATGPSTGLIVTLIFFILATFLAGTVAYFGYAEVKDAEKKAADAKKAEDAAKAQAQDQEIKRLTLRMAMGIDTPEDRQNFQYLADAGKRGPAAMEEVKEINAKLKLGGANFTWTVSNDKPDPAPVQSIPQIVGAYAQQAQDALKAQQTAEKGKQDADNARDAAKRDRDNEKAAFDKGRQKFAEDVDKLNKDKTEQFNKYQADLTKLTDENGDLKKKMQELEDNLRKEIDRKDRRIKDMEGQIAKLEDRASRSMDLAKLDQAKGTVERREGTFVYLNLGSAHYLRPQTTFTILPAAGSWRNFEEQQAQIKGQIEVVEVLGPYSSRAKILDEKQPIRDPIRTRDQLYNVAWTPGARDHIAFAGIIDLNGDGVDDNLEFIRILERQGNVVDSWLDLRDRQIKGKGMSLSTKFLVLGPEVQLTEEESKHLDSDPRAAAKQEIVTKMGQMRDEARRFAVQVIDARKFLSMIGYKVPERPAQAEYGASIYLRRGDGTAKDETPEEPKKDAPAPPAKKGNGKKDEGQ